MIGNPSCGGCMADGEICMYLDPCTADPSMPAGLLYRNYEIWGNIRKRGREKGYIRIL